MNKLRTYYESSMVANSVAESRERKVLENCTKKKGCSTLENSVRKQSGV